MRLFFIFTLLLLISFAPSAFADRASDLRNQISDTATRIAQLEAEIQAFQTELNKVAGQKNTLQGAIQALDINRKKIGTDISATEAKIYSANLTIEQLGDNIGNIETTIGSQKNVIERSIRDIYYRDEQSLVESILSGESFTDAMVRTDELLSFQDALEKNIDTLRADQEDLTDHKVSVEETKNKLSALKQDLASQKSSLDIARSEQQKLLTQTKNQESAYQKLLSDKQAARKQFESELDSLQAELTTVVDPSKIPKVGSGVLKWPFSYTFIGNCKGKETYLKNPYCITQYFGNTSFSTKNPQIYSGGGHNGIDFGAPSGTPLEAALSGVVKGTGNTDLVKGCYSYGQWILIEHGNGLSTLYGHLSRISVSEGQKVGTGDVIGYSGNTGYSTGPHLHFSVFATQGVQIVRFGDVKKITNCGNARVPVSPVSGYLNPLSYL